MLAFWSIYCKPCVEEISSLIRLQEQVGGENLEVIGINADSELGLARIRTFIGRFEEFEKRKINYSLIFDEDDSIGKLLGVGFLPTVLSVNLKGQVEKIFMGFEEKSEPEIFAGIRSLLPSEARERRGVDGGDDLRRRVGGAAVRLLRQPGVEGQLPGELRPAEGARAHRRDRAAQGAQDRAARRARRPRGEPAARAAGRRLLQAAGGLAPRRPLQGPRTA